MRGSQFCIHMETPPIWDSFMISLFSSKLILESTSLGRFLFLFLIFCFIIFKQNKKQIFRYINIVIFFKKKFLLFCSLLFAPIYTNLYLIYQLGYYYYYLKKKSYFSVICYLHKYKFLHGYFCFISCEEYMHLFKAVHMLKMMFFLLSHNLCL